MFEKDFRKFFVHGFCLPPKNVEVEGRVKQATAQETRGSLMDNVHLYSKGQGVSEVTQFLCDVRFQWHGASNFTNVFLYNLLIFAIQND